MQESSGLKIELKVRTNLDVYEPILHLSIRVPTAKFSLNTDLDKPLNPEPFNGMNIGNNLMQLYNSTIRWLRC